jgi:hypothetical protein
MGSLKKIISFLTVLLIAASLTLGNSVFAASTHATPTFTVRVVAYPYDVVPQPTSSTDPWTGETSTSTIPGYHVANISTEVVIKNVAGATFYNFRFKPYYSGDWSYEPYPPDDYFVSDGIGVPYQASTSEYTVIPLTFLMHQSITEGGQVDIQVQALFGSWDAEYFGHIFLPFPTYDFTYHGDVSGWSATQTITYNSSEYSTIEAPLWTPDEDSSTPTPTVTTQPIPQLATPSTAPTVTATPVPSGSTGDSFDFVWVVEVIAALYAVAAVACIIIVLIMKKRTVIR